MSEDDHETGKMIMGLVTLVVGIGYIIAVLAL